MCECLFSILFKTLWEEGKKQKSAEEAAAQIHLVSPSLDLGDEYTEACFVRLTCETHTFASADWAQQSPPLCLFVCITRPTQGKRHTVSPQSKMWKWNTLAGASNFISLTFITFVLGGEKNSTQKYIFLELLGEKYQPILCMGLRSRDKTDNCDCLGKPDFSRWSASGNSRWRRQPHLRNNVPFYII